MTIKLLLVAGCLALTACANTPASNSLSSACPSGDFGAFNQCLKTLLPSELGLADPVNRKQYLLYAEKLDQDRTLEGLSDPAAFAALKARLELLNRAPDEASQCSRFAERILCY